MGKRKTKRDNTLAVSLRSRIVKKVIGELKDDFAKYRDIYRWQRIYYATMIVCISLVTIKFLIMGV